MTIPKNATRLVAQNFGQFIIGLANKDVGGTLSLMEYKVVNDHLVEITFEYDQPLRAYNPENPGEDTKCKRVIISVEAIDY